MAEKGDNRRVVTYSGLLRDKAPLVSEELTHSSRSLVEGLAATALELQPSGQQELIKVLNDLQHGVFARGASTNKKDPERAVTALAGASALVAVEPSAEFKEAAQQMVDELRRRYSLR